MVLLDAEPSPAGAPRALLGRDQELAILRAFLTGAATDGGSRTAQIHHVGRRSGKAYVTPATAHVRGDVIVIALTFGNQSDWSRDVRRRRLLHPGERPRLPRHKSPVHQPGRRRGPHQLDVQPAERAGFRQLGIRQFMRLHAVPARSCMRPREPAHP